jgi:hypothetical protein
VDAAGQYTSGVSDPSAPDELHEVHLVGVPVAVWAKTQEHMDELIREFTLLSASLRRAGAHQEVPVKLTELIEVLSNRYSALTVEQEARLNDAAAKGVAKIDLVFRVPAQAAEAGAHLGALLDEADEYCRSGEHLLTLATPTELVRFRNWYLDAFTDQLAGKPPTAWADYPV